jgi:hypothetical protein
LSSNEPDSAAAPYREGEWTAEFVRATDPERLAALLNRRYMTLLAIAWGDIGVNDADDLRRVAREALIDA